MTVDVSVHQISKVEFAEKDGTAWFDLSDDDGREVTVFMYGKASTTKIIQDLRDVAEDLEKWNAGREPAGVVKDGIPVDEE